MYWNDAQDAAEKKLVPIVGKKRAFTLVCAAESHEPWFTISHNTKGLLTEADVDRLVAWLLERKDERDFQ